MFRGGLQIAQPYGTLEEPALSPRRGLLTEAGMGTMRGLITHPSHTGRKWQGPVFLLGSLASNAYPVSTLQSLTGLCAVL